MSVSIFPRSVCKDEGYLDRTQQSMEGLLIGLIGRAVYISDSEKHAETMAFLRWRRSEPPYLSPPNKICTLSFCLEPPAIDDDFGVDGDLP